MSTRFAFAYAYKSSSSANARDFLMKLRSVAPFRITRIQTDNGHEFQKHFVRSCQENNLVHFFNYPRHPQSNGHLERFNRTVQEQCVNYYLDYLDEPYDPDVIGAHGLPHLVSFQRRTEKPHRGIGKVPPMRYYLDNFVSPQKSNMLWTLTAPRLFR